MTPTPPEVPPVPTGDPLDRGDSAVSARVKNGVAIAITATWALGVLAEVLLDDFALSPFVHTAMLSLAASMFGSSFVKGIK